ncbi:hypothetical protein C1Y40_04670 [Mycobacterium talmoniae]|nr:hypothetical protein C1Y40_04670 [Mycobacterium talmoniae]
MMSDPAVLAAYKADPLVHHGFFTALLIDLVGTATVIDKTLLTYPGMRHDVCNEPGGEQVIIDITRWVAARVCYEPERPAGMV